MFLEHCDKLILHHLEKKAQRKIPISFLEKVFFCMPGDYFPSPGWRSQWEKKELMPFVEFNKSVTVNAWLYQTGSLLQKAGVNCDFFTNMPHLPEKGILVTMSTFLYAYPKEWHFSPSLFLAGIVADEGIVHPTAMLHLIPNRTATKYLPFTAFVPHWSQPFLIPRGLERGKTV